MTLERLPTWARVLALLFAIAAGWGIFVLVRPADSEPVPTALGSGDVSGERTLRVTVASCNKNPTGDIVETAETVTITAFARPAGRDENACADGLALTLDSPLGERAVVDGATGRTVPIHRPGWVQAGDSVSILVDQPLPDGTRNTATAHVDPSTVASQWATLDAFGPPPVFDPGRTLAVVITAAHAVDCPDDSLILVVKGSTLRLETTGDDSAVSCTPRDQGELIIASIAADVLDQVTSVSIRGTEVELASQ